MKIFLPLGCLFHKNLQHKTLDKRTTHKLQFAFITCLCKDPPENTHCWHLMKCHLFLITSKFKASSRLFSLIYSKYFTSGLFEPHFWSRFQSLSLNGYHIFNQKNISHNPSKPRSKVKKVTNSVHWKNVLNSSSNTFTNLRVLI